MPGIDEEVVVTPKVSVFQDAEHIVCCFDHDITMCGLHDPIPDFDWETALVGGADCVPCNALDGSGACPLGKDCDTWQLIRDNQGSAKSRSN
jgi:hypothetical protein